MDAGASGWLITVLGVVIGTGILFAFYLTVRTKWPVNYAGLRQDFGVVVSRGLVRYLVFALAPPYIVALLVSTTVSREGGHAMICAIGIGVTHVARTQVLLIANLLRQRRRERSNPTIIYAAVTTISVILVSWLGGLGPGPAQFVVPPLEEFFNAFWTTALVIVLAIAIARSMDNSTNISGLIQRSERELGDLPFLARQAAVDNDADPWLVEAILLTENLQRPRWFRILERLKGIIWRPGTYGPMQVWAPQPITDLESINIAIRKHLSGVRVKHGKYGPNNRSLRKALRRYNPNPSFVDLAQQIYEERYFFAQRTRD